VLEPLLNLLVADGILRRKDQDIEGQQSLCLTDKGYSTMKDLENLGYNRKATKETKAKIWSIASGTIVVLTFLILVYDTWFKEDYSNRQHLVPSANSGKIEQTNNDTILVKSNQDTAIRIGDSLSK